jgi:UDP-3-O-[3-hydroxymyristoyl] glucosamine N-acyltransferase
LFPTGARTRSLPAMELSFTPAAIEALVKPRKVAGSTDSAIRGIAALDSAKPGDLAFLANRKYRGAVAKCAASLILLPADFPGEPPPGQRWVFVDDPSVALTLLCRHVEAVMRPRPAPGVHPSAVVDSAATVAASAHIGPLCVIEAGAAIGAGTIVEAGSFIGRGAQIGDDCWLGPRSVVATQCVLGRRVRLQPGVIIGGDGYGYNTVGGRHEKIPQLGIVEIHDDVEIGAGCTIDRARFSKTVIGEGTKLDNLVQVGHNVVIGKHCLIVAQVGISGSTIIGDNVVIGGQAGFAGHIKVGDGAKIAGQTGVTSDLQPGVTVMGTPAIPMIAAIKSGVLLARLPELVRRVDKLESALGQPKNPST